VPKTSSASKYGFPGAQQMAGNASAHRPGLGGVPMQASVSQRATQQSITNAFSAKGPVKQASEGDKNSNLPMRAHHAPSK